MSIEDLPLIGASIFGVYFFIRLIVTFFKRGKQSIFAYWSRFWFRLLVAIYGIINIVQNVRSAAHIGKIFAYLPAINFTILIISLIFLVRSLQDFVCYSNPEATFIKRNWIPLTLLFAVASISSIILEYFIFDPHDLYSIAAARCVYHLLFLIFVHSLISFPALFFMNEITNNDFSGTMSCKINFARICFIIEIFTISFTSLFEVATSYTYFERVMNLTVSTIKDLTIIMVCFIQDMIDWMLHWLYLDEDEINKPDKYESARQKPLSINLIEDE
ncbi:hypothetical protein TVAG_433160 [Trichomonas vaginalis G3]|uniref:THH1/TOM1/TOM3 domain-containing protein n=1 Tax=Trichomonas vaginalis (strain ATCC PRA-98 / G3) TaxID=412133 RepID=A2DIV7_TRIV3|nr:hypothetical protein TVAGG3_0561930 [Trichomonas vaginalis G3]EAY19720.1 hypothetical protein TVAG_433160 [Trichomonas vaginalis G3]KAI5521260.1 hypothetical protein TVAGG3_0561930 [Trichomonas vaginalis G3]|eukprot:XP_001580706.1 hypothetical protein [Trichomonas vaginalis G3]